MTLLALVTLALAGLYTVLTLANLSIFRTPAVTDPNTALPAVSILIPARDEASNIGAALDAILASTGVEIEAIVLDDDSTDGTAGIVRGYAARDSRVRLLHGAPLPEGWNGKQHACWQLGRAARHPVLLFVDADVRLARDAAARLVICLERETLDLVSGFPRQITETWGEKLVIPQILVLLLGYLPLPMARFFDRAGMFAAGCGQLMAVRRDIYLHAGGHGSFAARMHDGLLLPKLIRQTGGRTDIVDTTPLASCRMYDDWADVWAGFTKNATEGMAKPVALPVWTILLGGHILPYLVVPLAWIAGAEQALGLGLVALGLLLTARLALALKVRQPLTSVAAHPIGVGLVLAIQWRAFVDARRGRKATWRGRSYGPG